MRYLCLVVAVALLGAAPANCAEAPAAGQKWGVRFADMILKRWPDPIDIDPKGWEYNTGIVMLGLQRIHEKTGDSRILAYIQRWVDSFVDAEGNIDWRGTHNLDLIQPAMLLLYMHDQTGQDRYRVAAARVRERFETFPRNAEGGFWHKQIYPDEMWVDGIFMAQPFLAGYGARFGDRQYCFRTPVEQATLLAEHVRDRKTGLYYHGWDQDRNAAWADPETGRSAEFWGRGVAWFAMALVELLDELPASQVGRARLEVLLRDLVRALAAVQDPCSGLWYEVLDKGDRKDNWPETSASGMLVYTIKTAVDRGYVEDTYRGVARRGWEGLKGKIEVDASGLPVITDAVEGTGVQQDYAAYLRRSRLRNSTHGLCAILLAASAMEW